MKRALALSLALASCGDGGPAEPTWGLQVVVTIADAEAARDGARIERALRLIERRLALAGFPHARVSRGAGDQLLARIPGADASNVHAASRALLASSRLEVFEAAHAAAQGGDERGAPEPPGRRRLRRPSQGYPWRLRDDQAWQAEEILVLREPVLRGPMILDAWTRPADGPAGSGWTVFVRLSEDGARRLLECGERLSGHRPSGVLVVVSVERPFALARFVPPDAANVTRLAEPLPDEQAARDLAGVLLSGSLDVELRKRGATGSFPLSADSAEFYGTPDPARGGSR